MAQDVPGGAARGLSPPSYRPAAAASSANIKREAGATGGGLRRAYLEGVVAVVQRVLRARVAVGSETTGEVARGLCVLAAVEVGDDALKAIKMADKLAGLRVFPSEDGSKPFDRDVTQVGGGVLLVSNFTLAAHTTRGRRPSLEPAAKPGAARPIFDLLCDLLRDRVPHLASGRFGADMAVEITNDGPVTLIVRT